MSRPCGATHVSDYGARTLVCNLDAGHELPHGLRAMPGLPPYVRWPVEYQPTAAERTRDGWRKPHVRRPYQTLGMWKARQR